MRKQQVLCGEVWGMGARLMFDGGGERGEGGFSVGTAAAGGVRLADGGEEVRVGGERGVRGRGRSVWEEAGNS